MNGPPPPDLQRLIEGIEVGWERPRAPLRETVTPRQCLCVLIYPNSVRRDRCGGVVYNPDAPLCTACYTSGHDDMPHVPYSEVIHPT